MKKVIRENYNCIDIGWHKGEMLDLMLKYAPKGKHYAFEPIPYLFEELAVKYRDKAVVFPYALADSNGKTVFHLVKNSPAYSGIKKRRYDVKNPKIEEIEVEMRTLEDVLSLEETIHFIKIDVEGGEFAVMKGAKKMLQCHKPVILFECGMGASDYYGTKPIDLYNFIVNEIGLQMYTLHAFLKNKKPMTADGFANYFDSNEEYYFVAADFSFSILN